MSFDDSLMKMLDFNMTIWKVMHFVTYCWILVTFVQFHFRGTLEGKCERKNYRELIEDPQLKLSGLYQKCVEVELRKLSVFNCHSFLLIFFQEDGSLCKLILKFQNKIGWCKC